MYPILRNVDLPQSFVATIAALCVGSGAREAMSIEINFYDGVFVSDDGAPLPEDARTRILQAGGIVKADASDTLDRWTLGLYAGLRHTRRVELVTWPSDHDPRVANATAIDRKKSWWQAAWMNGFAPGGRGTPPAHGTRVSWKDLDAGADPIKLIDRLHRELRPLLEPAVADMVVLHIPSRRGFRSLL